MTEVQMRELVSAAFAAAWPAASGGVPFALENEALPSSNTFVQLTITPTTSAQATHGKRGNRKVTRRGWIQVKMWGPANAGSAGLAGLGDIAQSILEMTSFPSPVPGDDPVTTLASDGARRLGGSDEDGRWYMGVVRVPFVFFERR